MYNPFIHDIKKKLFETMTNPKHKEIESIAYTIKKYIEFKRDLYVSPDSEMDELTDEIDDFI
jgi:hypothetical protein